LSWSGKQKKAFSRCLDGLRKANILGDRVRFLTLTTPACNGENLSSSDKKVLIQKLWRLLYKRIKDVNCEYDIDRYFSVRTAEGNGVIHVVFVGTRIDFAWIMEQWVEINGTPFIWICNPYKRFKSDKDVARYFVSQYIGFEQGSDFTYGFSQNWVYKGSNKDYLECKRWCRDYDREPIFVNYFGEPIYHLDYEMLGNVWYDWLEDKFLINRYDRIEDMIFERY